MHFIVLVFPHRILFTLGTDCVTAMIVTSRPAVTTMQMLKSSVVIASVKECIRDPLDLVLSRHVLVTTHWLTSAIKIIRMIADWYHLFVLTCLVNVIAVDFALHWYPLQGVIMHCERAMLLEPSGIALHTEGIPFLVVVVAPPMASDRVEK
jgi:hypothetical protein